MRQLNTHLTMAVWCAAVVLLAYSQQTTVFAGACCQECDATLNECYAQCDALHGSSDPDCTSKCRTDCQIDVIDKCSNGCIMCLEPYPEDRKCWSCSTQDSHTHPGEPGVTYEHVSSCWEEDCDF